MSDWNEFHVTFVRSWLAEVRRRPDDKVMVRPDWPVGSLKPAWGIEVDANGAARVDVGLAVNGWKEYILSELMFSASRFRTLKVGPFVFDDGWLEIGIGGGVNMVLKGRMVLLASTQAEAVEVLDEFRRLGKLPDEISVLSELEALAKAAEEESDE